MTKTVRSRGSIATLVASGLLPLMPQERRYSGHRGTHTVCRYCCKSPKLPDANFPAVKKSNRPPPIDVASITQPRSPASLSSDNEVPHIFTRKSRVQPKENLITSAKRLLQQYLPGADSCGATRWRSVIGAGIRTEHCATSGMTIARFTAACQSR